MIQKRPLRPAPVPACRDLRCPCCGMPRLKFWHIACAKCWAKVPAEIQSRVVHGYCHARQSQGHMQAIREAFKVIRLSEPKTLPDCLEAGYTCIQEANALRALPPEASHGEWREIVTGRNTSLHVCDGRRLYFTTDYSD